MNNKQSQNAIREILKFSNKKMLNQFIAKALRYVSLRVNWYCSGQQGRMDMDDERTRAHNVFIDYCNIISREMQKQELDTSWRKELGKDRKLIGDFACFLVAEIGVRAR